MNEELIRSVAERVLKRLGNEPARTVLPESQVNSAPIDYFAPWTSEVYSAGPRLAAAHPSQEHFNIGEAAERAAVVRELVEFLEAEKCSIEKDKPCDHCGSCRTLGF
jgi:hypothetical protein